jgi:hypothetical protein
LSTVLVTHLYFEWVNPADVQIATVPIREARYLEGVVDGAIQKLRDAKDLSSLKVNAMMEVKLVYSTLKRMEMRFCIALRDAVC